MEPLMLDRNGEPLFVGDYVLIGLMSNGMGAIGKMYAGQITGMTGYGIQIAGHDKRIKVSHRLTKVDESWALQFQEYLK